MPSDTTPRILRRSILKSPGSTAPTRANGTTMPAVMFGVVLGWVGPQYRLVALSIAGVVCIASSNGGTTSQDLKTGYLVGATPWKQQVSILVGALVSAVVMGGTLLWLNDAYSTTTERARRPPQRQGRRLEADRHPGGHGREVVQGLVGRESPGARRPARQVPGRRHGPARYLIDPGIGGRLNYSTSGAPLKKFNPPQPRLFATIIDGIMAGNLPWGLVILGAVLAIVMQLAGVSALAFAVGVYLPLSTTMPIFVGGMIRALVDRPRKFTRRGVGDEPGHHDVHRPDRRRLARRDHHRAPGRLREAGPGPRLLDHDARRRARVSHPRDRRLRRARRWPSPPWP